MSLRVTSVRIANPSRQQFLHTILTEIPTPPGEPWLARLAEDESTGVWELLVAGPGHAGECEGWEVSRTIDERLRFRALLRSRNEQSADMVRRRVRRLAWNGVRFTLSGTAGKDPQLTQAFEDAAWDVVLAAHVSALEVRLSFWSPTPGDVHCYCEIEAAPGEGGSHARHTWCPLVRSPAELALAIDAAVRGLRGEPQHALESVLSASAESASPVWPPHDDGSHPLEGLLIPIGEDDSSQETTHWV
jgi:hypothetical protein